MIKVIGIITFNRVYLLEECIESLNQVLGDCRQDYMIAVFDDHSDDETKEYLTQALSEKQVDKFFLSDTRLGVARNSNRVIKYFKELNGDILFILNDDVTLLGNVFKVYEEAFAKTDYHHFCFNDIKSPNQSFNTFNDSGIDFTEYYLITDGVCLSFDKKAIETIGGFNPAFYFSVEHIEMSHRAVLAGLNGEHRLLDVTQAKDMIRVNQFYRTIPPSLAKANEFKSVGRDIWSECYLNPTIYQEI